MKITEIKAKASAVNDAIDRIADLISQRESRLETAKEKLTDSDLDGWYRDSLNNEVESLPYEINYLVKIAENLSKGL